MPERDRGATPPDHRPTLSERARGVVERFSVFALAVAIGIASLLAGVAAVVSLRAPEEYESRAVLVIDNPLALATAGDDGIVNKLDRLRGKYATLAATQAIAGPVSEELGVSPGAVLSSTEVFAAPATLSLVVVGRAGDADAAVARASALAEGIIAYVEAEHVAHDVPLPDRFEFQMAQSARSAIKLSPSTERATEAAGITFGVALVVCYVVVQFLRTPVVVPDEPDGMTAGDR